MYVVERMMLRTPLCCISTNPFLVRCIKQSAQIMTLGLFASLFVGESMDADAMILMVEYRDIDGEERPIIMGFKHGLRETKC